MAINSAQIKNLMKDLQIKLNKLPLQVNKNFFYHTTKRDVPFVSIKYNNKLHSICYFATKGQYRLYISGKKKRTFSSQQLVLKHFKSLLCKEGM